MQDDILEEIRKRREELEKENEIFSIETNEETGEKTPVINFDKMPIQDQITLEINALRNGYVNEEMQVAKQQADKAEAALLENATRAELADYFTVYSKESNRAATSNDIIGYYQSEIMKSRIKNRLGESATPKTFLGDTAREFGYNAKGAIADTANLIDMGYVTLTDNLDADVLYNVAKSTNGDLQNTLKNYGWGKENYERLEKLREQYPNDDIIESLYNTVTKQNFQGDKNYFDSTVKYINQLTNSDRFQKFQKEHTLDETQARENLKLQESMSYGKGAQFALDVAGTLGYMAPSIALGVSANAALGSGITTKAGTQLLSQNAGREIAKQVGLTTMAAAAAGQSGTSTFNQGYEWNQVLSKAATDGLLEYVSEVVGGEALNKLLVGTRTAVTPVGRAIGSLIENTGIKHKGVRLALGILGDITAEAWEEMAVEMITPILDEKILGKKIDDWGKYGEDIFNAGLQSIVPTLILGGMNRAQVSHAIKIQMENLTLAVETAPTAYISEEQKEKLLNGIVEAYDNAAHFLSDASSEEQYNQIVEETYKALNEATEKYKSAQELAKLINARTNLEKSQQRESIFDENIQGIMQTQAAEKTVNRLNNAEQEINDSIKERNLNTNLTRALSQNAFKKSSEQPSLQVKAGETYNVEFEGKPAEIIVRSIQPDEETGELMAVVEATLEGKPFYGAEPVVMPLTDLEKRITELTPTQETTRKANIRKGKQAPQSLRKNKPTQLKSAITNDDYLTKWKNFYDEVLAQIPEEEINEEALRMFEQKIGETLDMDAWDYVDEDTMEKARANAIERFLATPKGQELLEKYGAEESKPKKTLKKNKPNDTNDTKNQKFATDMETNDKSIIDRMIKRVMADPSLREEHDTTSIREIRELTRQFLKGRLGVGQYRDRAYGVYNPLSNWVRLRQISNIDTLMHETGHYIDDEVVKKMYESHPEMKDELRKLCEMAFPKRYTGKLKLMEGFAEATRYFIVAPKELVKLAPTTAAIIAQEFDKSPELSKLYPKLQKMCHDYINMTPDERVDSQVISGTPNNKVSIDSPIRRAIRTVTRFMFNKNEAATMFDERNEKLLKAKYGNKKSLPTTLKLFDNLRRANSSGESIKQQLTNGVYDPVDGKRITKGLARIIEPFKEEAKAEAKKNGMSYDKYLNKRLTEMNRVGLAERTIELAGRSVAENKLYETGIRFDDAKDIIDRYKNDTTLHKVLDDLRQVGRDIVDYAVKKGVIKQRTANEIKKKNLFYIPLNRIMDGYSSFGSSTNDGATGSAFKALHGSDREIQNPLESFVGNWARVLKVIDDNYIRQQLVKVAHEVGDYGDFFTEVAPLTKFQGQVTLEAFEKYLQYQLSEEEFDSLDLEQTYNLFVPEMADKNKMTISYLQNGVRKYIKFANNDYGRPLYELLANLNARQSNVILNAISLFNQGIRLGATTLNPFFAIGNTLSDQFQAFLYSDGLVLPIANIFFDAARLGKARFFNKFDIGNKSDKELAKLYRIYKESGASLSGKYKLAETEVMKTLPDIYGVSNKALFGNESKLNKVKDIFSNFGKLLAYFPEFSEEMTRFGEFVRVYDKLTKDGMKPSQAKLEAGIKAKEITQDFSIQGEAMQYLNKIIPFSAAKVGSLYRFNQEFKKHPARLTMRMGALIGMAMLLAELRHGDDEAEAYYEELNNRKKFDSFVFPIGGSEPFIMKKPQGTPRYFINLAEYMYDLATGYIPEGEEEKRFKDWLELSVTDQLPISSPTDMIPGFAQSLLENVLNVDFYYGSKIVPQDLEKLDPRHQYNEYTSEIAKAIGNIFNISPMQIDNFIEGTFAGMGSFALDTGDWLYDTITGNDTRVKSQSYAKSRLFADVYRSSESVNIVYDKLEKYETEEAEGRLTAEQQEDYDNLKVAKTTFTKISKEMKAIRTDSTLSTEQKAEKLDKLYEIRTDVARYYLGKNLLNPDNKDRVERYKYYPASSTYKYNVGNKKVDVSFEDEEIQEEYSKRLKELYERELEQLKRKSTYKNATDSEKLEQEKNLLGNTRNKVNEIMKPIAYRKQRGG